MTNLGDQSELADERFRKAISQLRDLANGCDELTFLIGAGCSKCAGLPLTMELTESVLTNSSIDCTSKNILAGVQAVFAEAEGSHIEDYLSEIIDLLAITDRRAERGVQGNTIPVGTTEYTAKQLREASNQIKRAIALAIEKKVSLTTHREFVSSVHQPTRAGRPASGRPVDYVVLNYDTIIEDALALENVAYADGLYGGATGWWHPATFDTPGLSARVIKLHGSIDWRQFPDEYSPRRIGKGVKMPFEYDLPVLIWPSSTKYQETQMDPFAQLMERARAAIRPTSGLQRLLVICGYSFGDNHINLEVDRALKESGGQLTVAAFGGTDKPTGQLAEWLNDPLVRQQVLAFTRRGFFHGENQEIATSELSWWQFENLTGLLRGSS